MIKRYISIVICLLAAGCVSKPKFDYLTTRVRINGQPSMLILDTGSSNLVLSRNEAERLNLEVSNPPENLQLSPSSVPIGYSEKCRLSCPDMNYEGDVIFGIFDASFGANTLLGFFGWPNIKCNILYIDADNKVMKGLEKLPADIDTWSKWPIYGYSDFSVLLIAVQDQGGQDGAILIDTGDPGGVSLNSQRWNDLKDSQEGQPHTLTAFYTPAVGLKAYEEYRPETLAIGEFTFSNVPVRPSDPIWEQAFPNYQATLGLFALSQMDVIIDGSGGTVYTRPNKNPRFIYHHNRAGATFVPEDAESDQLAAHVVENGPAYQAGLRKGDVLLEVNGRDVSKWRTDSTVLSSFYQRPGKKIKLSLLRGDEPVSVTIELADIFPEKSTGKNNRKQHTFPAKDDLAWKPITFCEDSNILEKINQYRQDSEQGNAEAQYELGLTYAGGKGLPQDYNEAFKWWNASAEQGNADAQTGLGVLYLNGYGVEKDETKAFEFFTKAALMGVEEAQYHLGMSYFTGTGVDQNYSEAANWLEKAAKQGNVDAMYNLGVLYRDGLGVDQDYIKAVEFFTELTSRGDVKARINLGNMYLNGYGVEEDYAKAFELFTQAIDQANIPELGIALVNLGLMYLNGLGMEQDFTKAYELFTEAIENGDSSAVTLAKVKLGGMYLMGYGVEINYKKAVSLFTEAAEQENLEAQYNLAVMYRDGYGVEQDTAKAVEFFTAIALKGDIFAQINLATMYLNGQGVEKDYAKAFELYTQVAEQGDTSALALAQVNLGTMYLNGYGVEKDYPKAFELFTQAVRGGNTPALAPAQSNLSIMYMKGYGVELNYTEAYKWALLGGINGNYERQMMEYLESKMTAKQKAEGRRLANEYLEQNKTQDPN